MPDVNRLFETIEAKGNLTTTVLLQMKIHKVMKAVAKLENIPRDDEFKLRERARAMYERWRDMLKVSSTASAL